MFDVVEIDCTKRRQRLLQGRASLNLDELILEITARKVCNDLSPLLRRIVVVSNPDDVHQDTRVGEGNLRPHVHRNARGRMQGDCFPHQICFQVGDAMTFEKFARCIGAVDLEPLGLGVIGISQSQVVEQRRDIEQFSVEFQVLADAFDRSEQE
jgi:hypothetical protein